MTESQFIEKNKKYWKELEALLDNKNPNADALCEKFTKVSGDLSYAQTFYPHRSIKWYLNNLVNRVFDLMKTKNQINFLSDLKKFYSETLPIEILRNKNAFLTSLSIFSISVIIGIFSMMEDDQFAVSILGKAYVQITTENIDKGDPMAIYKSGTRVGSFLAITLNNIQVSFFAFVLGLLGSFGTAYILIRNGIMLGVFQTFFYKKGLFLTSFLTIWIHGTLEISAIIISGAAGIILGNSILFPSTYTRIQAIQLGAIRSMYILLSATPLFIIAGIFEGFVTPLSTLPNGIKAMIILISLAIIVMLYIISPYLYHKKHSGILPSSEKLLSNEAVNYSTDTNDVIQPALSKYFGLLPNLVAYVMVPSTVITAIALYHHFKILSFEQDFNLTNLYNYKVGGYKLIVLFNLLFMFLFSMLTLDLNNQHKDFRKIFQNLMNHFVAYSFCAIMISTPFLFFSKWSALLICVFLPISSIAYIIKNVNKNRSDVSIITHAVITHFNFYIPMSGIFIACSLVGVTCILAIMISSGFLVENFLSWHRIFDDNRIEKAFLTHWLDFNLLMFLMPWFLYLFIFKINQLMNEKYSIDLKEKIKLLFK